MNDQPSTNQPGDPTQLAKMVEAVERYYESSRKGIIVYWDEKANRYRIDYTSQYKSSNTIEVVRIPK
jgi:hypothetical protein